MPSSLCNNTKGTLQVASEGEIDAPCQRGNRLAGLYVHLHVSFCKLLIEK